MDSFEACAGKLDGWLLFLACYHPSIFVLMVAAAIAGVSAFIAIKAMKSNQKGQRIVSTLTFLWEILRDEQFIESSKSLMALADDQDRLSKMGLRANYKDFDDEGRAAVDDIRILVSTWEAVALAVAHKGYEDSMLQGALKTICIRQFETAEPFITSTRNVEPKCALQWQAMVEKWRKAKP
mgnify:CR=1 FL=1